MSMFFADLVIRTDEARRAFETHPVVLDAVAHGMPLERYRTLLLELYHVVWHFNPVSAAAASRMGDSAQAGALLPLRAHARGVGPRGVGAATTSRRSACTRGDHARLRASAVHTLALVRLQLLGRRPPPPVLGAGHALCAGGDRLGLRRPVRLGDQGVAAARGRARRVVHRLARHDGRRSTWPTCARCSTRSTTKPARDAVVESTLRQLPPLHAHHRSRYDARPDLAAAGLPGAARPAVQVHPARVEFRPRHAARAHLRQADPVLQPGRPWPSCSRCSTTSPPTRAWCATS